MVCDVCRNKTVLLKKRIHEKRKRKQKQALQVGCFWVFPCSLFAIPSMTKQLIIEHPLWGYPSLGAGEAAVKKVGKDSNFTRLSQENMGGAIVNTLYKHAHQKSEV